MSEINDGGSAFPFVSHGGIHEHQACDPGMTLRDYFAAKALQGMFANPNVVKSNGLFNEANFTEAWAAADAMLKAREAKP